jgi:hypothetical protein
VGDGETVGGRIPAAQWSASDSGNRWGPDATGVVGFGARSTQWGKLADGLGGLSPVQGSRAGLLNLFPFSTIFQMVSKDQCSKLQNMNLQMSKNFQTQHSC